MIKQSIYPKTIRVEIENDIQITEKLDGSNLGIGIYNGEIVLFTRNNVYFENELETYSKILYKGLYDFIAKNKDKIRNSINENTVIFGEYIGMGHIKYDGFSKFYVFAKGKIELKDNLFELSYMNYDLDNIHYAFKDGIFPFDIFNIVPIIKHALKYIDKENLDKLYDEYLANENRIVEGFVIVDKKYNIPLKYVRYKRGKMQEHFCWELNSIKLKSLFVEKSFGVNAYFDGNEIIYYHSELLNSKELSKLIGETKNKISKMNKENINSLISDENLKLIKMNTK